MPAVTPTRKVLREAGFVAYHVPYRYARAVPGFSVDYMDGQSVKVYYLPEHHSLKDEESDRHWLAQYSSALLSAGFAVEDKGGWLVVKDKEGKVDA